MEGEEATVVLGAIVAQTRGSLKSDLGHSLQGHCSLCIAGIAGQRALQHAKTLLTVMWQRWSGVFIL